MFASVPSVNLMKCIFINQKHCNYRSLILFYYFRDTCRILIQPSNTMKLTRDPPTGRKFNVSYFKYQFYNYGWNATMQHAGLRFDEAVGKGS